MGGTRLHPQLSFNDLPGAERTWARTGVAHPWSMSVEQVAKPTWEDHYQWGNEAFELAQDIEAMDGLTPAAIAAYKEASDNLNLVTATCRAIIDKDDFENITFIIPDNPTRLLKIAASYEKQARAEEIEPYSSEESKDIDRRAFMQNLAKELFYRARDMLIGKDSPDLEVGSFEATPEVVGLAAMQAISEVRGPEVIDHDTAERLIEGDKDTLAEVIGLQLPATDPETLEPDPEGAEIASRTGEIILEKITETHLLAVAA